MSFHGIPQRYLLAGDPYHCHCHATARALAAALELGANDWTLAFQSRVGRERWLEPYTDAMLTARGVRALDVICPGFAVDCLETLEEIEMAGRAQFLAAGGEQFHYIAALNDSAEHAALIAQIVRERSTHWPEFSASAMHDESTGRALTVERFRNLSSNR